MFSYLLYVTLMSTFKIGSIAQTNHGRLVWTTFDSAEIVRQTESEQQLRGVLMSSRTYTTTSKSIGYSSFSGRISA